MRGQHLHNHVLLDPIESHFREIGAAVHREHFVRSGAFVGFVDLFVRIGQHSIACEAERSTARIDLDVKKAILVGATELWIIVPGPALVRAVGRKLRSSANRDAMLRVSVLTLGAARTRLTASFPLISSSNGQGRERPRTMEGH